MRNWLEATKARLLPISAASAASMESRSLGPVQCKIVRPSTIASTLPGPTVQITVAL
jgi:hypothetical protein